MGSADAFLGVQPARPAPPPPAVNSAADFLGGAAPAPAPANAWSLDLINQHAGPGQITSARRSAARNAAVGGSKTSSHLTGDAFDFAPQDGNTAKAARALANAGIPYDQIIDEGDHVHIGWGPKMRGQFMPQQGKSKVWSAAAFLGDVGKITARNAGEDISAMSAKGKAMLKEGIDEFSNPQTYGPQSVITGALKMGGGAFGMGVAPVTGMLQDAFGRPAEKLTGGAIPKEFVGDASETILGFLMGGPKPKTARVPEAVEYRPFRATKAERAAAIEGEARAVAPAAEDFLTAGPTPRADEFLRAPKTMAAKVEDSIDDILMAPRGPVRTVEPEPVQPKGVKEATVDAAKAVQSILAPATMGAGREAAGTIRRAASEGDLLAAQSAQALVRHAAKVSSLSVPEQRALVAYIEGRSNTGAQLADRSLQSAADDIRKVNDSYRSRIESVLEDGEEMPFIQDYYTHLWKNAPGDVERAMASRQGSGRNLKQRSIPTLQEGIDAGLTPVTENPIEATLLYANNMSKYLATLDVQKELAGAKMTEWATPGAQPRGWVPLSGIRTAKPGRAIIQDGERTANYPGLTLYAEPDVARVYNNWISSGFDVGDTAGLFDPIRKASNGMTMLKLGLSAFHATTMAQEAVISEIARGVGAASRGDAATAAAAMAKAPGAFIGRAMRGDRMRRELLNLAPPEGMSAAVNDAFIRSGGRVRMDPLLRTRGAGSFYNAVHNGTWKTELRDTAQKIFGPGQLLSQRAAGVIDLGANAIQTVAAPLFEYYIPRLKMGAFASNMEDWLKANPLAKQREIDEAATLINRSIDNRFGEMAWDNLFWHRYLKQASQIMLLSPTWNLGTINEIGGGLYDMLGPSAKGLVTGKGITQRTAYVAALAAYVPLINGILTYLKTGTPPKDMDYLAYRTGGTDITSGEPERALLPGYQKDVYAFGYDFPNHIGQEVSNKLNPALKMALEIGANKDFRDLPIRDVNAPFMDQASQFGDYALEQLMPISIGQLAKGDKIGSNISPAEKALAIRPAPAYLQSPERIERLQKLNQRHEWARKERADRRDRARRGQQ